MASPYRALFAAPGTKGFAAAGFVGRMPLSMMGIGVVTMISQLTGRYGLAGALSATIALSAALVGPQISRLVDQHGQRRVLRPATLVALVAAAGMLVAAHWSWPDWSLFVFSAGIGAVPSLGAMVRARWAALYRGTPQLHTAYSFESVVDEVCFIFGPIISIGLSTAWFPEAGPLLAACFLAVGVFWLTAQRATEPKPHPRARTGGGSALRSAGLQVLVVTFVATGAIFGAVDVVTVAFADERGHKAAASLVLAVYAAGSCLAGIVFGLLRLPGAPQRRWLLGVVAMAVSMIPLLLVGNLPFLAVALFVAGLSIAPTMITTMSLIEEHVPRAQLTEGMTWISTGLAVGVALGSSVAGWVIDAAGARAGYGVPAVSGAVAVVVGFLGYRRLSRPATGRGGTVEQHSEREERHVA
ncbi:MFS transporter [Streptomyces acidiscabies]|uniref:MFS transporter n=1 Tax=Streptomyces acidiscabies TaxID=42234 RepID=A0A0L0K4X7_9ACTN|nr:MFS transporter [Streptomyces acidiscabies]KND32863.1 MFS transporter [Streptomyces acidiscabies]MBZ3915692.1 MFS transporter [Streptomyces acidiscabies]MDX2960096.1 MFS transporter [Streptomyces acidiscabies]MDX3019447.1 MFS transporter [Streptomyces acidiscabies]MDX3793154.1 MFS transporter [Streptomyces acidiscabies]